MHIFFLAEAPAVDVPAPIVILIIGLVACLCMMVGLFIVSRRFYRIPPPDHALIRTGAGGPKAVSGSGIWVFPIIHRADLLSLAAIRVDLSGTELDSEPARSRELPSIFEVAVPLEHDMILVAADRLLALPSESTIAVITDIILDEYERLLSQESDDASSDPPAIRFIEGVEQALNTVGLTIVACRRQ